MITLAIASGVLVIVLLFAYHNEHNERVRIMEKYHIACELGAAIRKAASDKIDSWGIEHAEIREADRKKNHQLTDELAEANTTLDAVKLSAQNVKLGVQNELICLNREIESLKADNRTVVNCHTAEVATKDRLAKENDSLKAEIQDLQLTLEDHDLIYIFKPAATAKQRYGKPFPHGLIKSQLRYIGQYGERDCWFGELDSMEGLVLAICTIFRNSNNQEFIYWKELSKESSKIASFSPGEDGPAWRAVLATHNYLQDNNMLPRHPVPKDRGNAIFLGQAGDYDAWFIGALPDTCYDSGEPGIGLVLGNNRWDFWTESATGTLPPRYLLARSLARERGLFPEEKEEPTDDFDPDAPQRYDLPSYVGEHPEFVGQYKDCDCWLGYLNDEWRLFLTLFDGVFAPSDMVSSIQPEANSEKFVKVCEGLKQRGMVPRTDPPKDEKQPIFLGQSGDYDTWFVGSNSGNTQQSPTCWPAIYITAATDRRTLQSRMTIANIDEEYRKIKRPSAMAICKGCDLAMERGLVPKETEDKDAVDPVMVPSNVSYPGNRDKPRMAPPANIIKPEFLGCVGDYDAWIVKSGWREPEHFPAIITIKPGNQARETITKIGDTYRSWADPDHPATTSICKGLDLAIEQGHVEGKFTFPKHGTPSGHENLVFLDRHDKYDMWLAKTNDHPPYILVFGNHYSNLVVALSGINDKSYRADKDPRRIAVCKGYDVAVERGLLTKEEPTQDNPRYNPPSGQTNPVFLCQHDDYDIWFVESMNLNDKGNCNHGQPCICIVHKSYKGAVNRDFMPCNELSPDSRYRNSATKTSKTICYGYDEACKQNLIS